jgi:4-hydroxy-2-oxoheptanedioate aldolase
MRPSRVRQRWAEGKPALATTVHLTDPSVAEMASLLGFDCLWIDMEHHFTSVETAGQMMRAARVGGADVMARPAKGEFMRMARMLEAGAHGILYPRCDDDAEAAEVVRWAKFAPMGQRGIDTGNPDAPFIPTDTAAYIRDANAETWIAIQIESPEAAKHTRAIAEVPGVDVIFFGPGDYSVLTGEPGAMWNSPAVLAAAEQVARDTLQAGKRFAVPVFTPDLARHMLDLGATLLTVGSDIGLVKKAWLQIQQDYAPLGFTFENQI